MSRQVIFILFNFILLSLLISPVFSSCKSGEGDPYAPHPSPTQRIYSYSSNNAGADTSSKSGTTLDILSYNIQSGLSNTCAYNLEAQAQLMRSAHFFGLQEVDENNDLRCWCSQPSVVSQITGHTVLFLNTIFYRTGRYGSAMGTSIPILETRYKMFQNYYGEERGLTAMRTQPSQLGGRTLWYINTHFQFDGEYWRNLQAQEVVSFTQGLLAEYPQALVIVTGDFYITPGLGSYATMEAYFRNAWSVFSGSSDGGFTYPSNYPTNRFDHIWFRFPEGTQYSLKVEIGETEMSDHRPLWAHFNFGSVAPPPPTCQVQISAVLRSGTTQAVNNGQGIQGTYDLVVKNTGSKTALRANFNINLPAGSTITSWWFFARLPPTYMDLPSLSPGASYYQAGFILQFPSSTSLIPATYTLGNTLCAA